MRASRCVSPERFHRRESLVLEVSVDGPVDPIQRPVGHAVRAEAERDSEPGDLAIGVVGLDAERTESRLVHIPWPAPLPDKIRLAGSDEARVSRLSQDVFVGELEVLDSMAQRIAR